MSIKQYIPYPVKEQIKGLIVKAVKSPPMRAINVAKFKSHAKKNGSIRLHFGCGPRHLDGWINIDLFPNTPSPDVLIDLQKPLPLQKATVDYIYTEDLIEHLTYDGACKLLSECARVLKPGGKIRIGTPDLVSFIGAYMNRSEQDLIWYREHLGSKTFAEMFNAGMRAWGHTFIYDEETLTGLLNERGFSVIRKQSNETDAAAFEGLDLRDANDGAHSMFLECTRVEKAIKPQSQVKEAVFAK